MLVDIIQDLHHRLNAVTSTLDANPGLVNDPGAPEMQELRDLYSPSPTSMYDLVLRGLRNAAAQGTAIRAGPSGVRADDLVWDVLESDDPDQLTYYVCFYGDYEQYRVSTGEVVVAQVMVLEGIGYADRVDGVWRIRAFGVFEDESEVEHYPPGTPNPCPTRISEPAG